MESIDLNKLSALAGSASLFVMDKPIVFGSVSASTGVLDAEKPRQDTGFSFSSSVSASFNVNTPMPDALSRLFEEPPLYDVHIVEKPKYGKVPRKWKKAGGIRNTKGKRKLASLMKRMFSEVVVQRVALNTNASRKVSKSSELKEGMLTYEVSSPVVLAKPNVRNANGELIVTHDTLDKFKDVYIDLSSKQNK